MNLKLTKSSCAIAILAVYLVISLFGFIFMAVEKASKPETIVETKQEITYYQFRKNIPVTRVDFKCPTCGEAYSITWVDPVEVEDLGKSKSTSNVKYCSHCGTDLYAAVFEETYY